MIHSFSMYGDSIVLDVNSGAVYLFDELASALLDMVSDGGHIIGSWKDQRASIERIVDDLAENTITKSLVKSPEQSLPILISDIENLIIKHGKEAASETLDEIEHLIEDDLLFSRDHNAEEMSTLEMTHVFKSICLHVAHNCNMRCGYCFASEGNFGMRSELMDFAVAKGAIDFIVKASDGRRNIEVDFFGGEPLLNFDVIQRTVDYAREQEPEHNKKFRFTLTTNGLLLNNRIIDYINENMDNLVLSLDGRREVNDNMRKCRDGSGSYDVVLPKFKSLVERRAGKDYYMRGTYTALNKDFKEDVLHIVDLGFDQVSVEPVAAPGDDSLKLKKSDMEFIKRQYEELAFEYRKRRIENCGFNFFHFMVDLDHGPCLSKRITGCGAGYEYAAVAPNGDVYPCHQFVGKEEMKIGSVFAGINNEKLINEFKRANVYNKNKCRSCWAKFFCSGGCAANAYITNGSVYEPDNIYCELTKKRLECAIWLHATANTH